MASSSASADIDTSSTVADVEQAQSSRRGKLRRQATTEDELKKDFEKLKDVSGEETIDEQEVKKDAEVDGGGT